MTDSIRRATASDLDAIVAIEQACFDLDEAFPRRVLRYLITQAEGSCYVTEHDGRITGYISLLKRRTTGNLRVYSVAVLPEARGKGDGQRMIDQAVKEARQLGLREVTLEVRVDNEAALVLYTRNGFHTDRILSGYYPGNVDARHMTRPVME